MGKIHIHTVLDCFSHYVWARLYTSKMPVTAVQILNNHALPFFEEYAVKAQAILSDNGREYCGRPDKHPYETVAEMQEDLDAYLETCNTRRSHRGRGMEGRTPYEVFKAGIPATSPARTKPARKEAKTAA